MTKSKKKQSLERNAAKARLNNSKNNKSPSTSETSTIFNTAMMNSQLERSDVSMLDDTPEDLIPGNNSNDCDSDVTPEDLASSSESEHHTDPDFSDPKADKLMIIPFSFIQKLLNLVSCPECQNQGRINATVTNICGFSNDINFLCRCKNSFSLSNFDDTNINDVLVRNLISNGIPKQPFQRWLQVLNFGAIVDGEEYGINLFSKSSMNTYKQQNNEIIKGAEDMHKQEIDQLYRACKDVIISTDMCYAKRGYHSPAGHAALISGGKVIDARTIKRASQTSENAYGDITDKQANKIEAYAVVKMFKDVIPVIGPLITQIHVDQDASIQNVIVNMKWEAEDVSKINKFTGKQEINEDMVGQSVWGGKIPEIHPDKVKFY